MIPRRLLRTIIVAVVLVAAVPHVLVGAAPHVVAAAPRVDAARRGADWIASEQQDDGGVFTSGQRVDQTAEALASFIAGRGAGRTVSRALAYVRSNGPTGASRGAYTGRIVAALVAAGEDPRSFGGTDYVRKLRRQYDAASGRYDGENLFSHLQGANGDLAAGSDLPANAVDAIFSDACAGGGFGYENACAKGPDVDTTAWAINVLAHAGRQSDGRVSAARSYLLSAQQPDGGFGFTRDKATSADSTGLVLAAIDALGEKAINTPWRQRDGDDPVKALLSLQNDDGSFRFVSSSRKGNALSTTNALPGLAGVSYPVPGPDANNGAGRTAAPTIDPRADDLSSTAPPSGESAPSTTATAGASQTPATPTDPTAPFAATASDENAGGVPAPLVWGGLIAIAGATGGGVWWLYRRSL